MGINYNKGNSKEKNIISLNNEIIKSNLNEKKTSINNFIQSNSLLITESKNQINQNIKKSKLNDNCTIENILKLSENITSNYFQKHFFSSNQSLYTSLFLFKDLNFNQQIYEKLFKQRIKKLKKILNIQNFNKITIRNNEQTQSLYSKILFTNDINLNLNDTRSKILNIYKNEEFKSNYNIIKQNSIIKEPKEYDTFSSPLILKYKKLNEHFLLKNKNHFHFIQKEYSNQIRNITLNKRKDNSINIINNEIINSNRSSSPKFRNNSNNKNKNLQLTQFYINDNNNNFDIFNFPFGISLLNFFQENLSPYNQIYENEKNNIKSFNIDNFYKEKNTLKHKLTNKKFKIDIKEFIKDKNDIKIHRFNIMKKKNNIDNNNIINKTNFITQYEKYIGNDQSYKTKKPINYNNSFNELKSNTIMNKILYEPNDNKIKNTFGNIIEEDCDFNNNSYLDMNFYNQKKENLPSLNKEIFNKTFLNNQAYNNIIKANTHRKGITNFIPFKKEKNESKK